jgi:hypothetical protein
MIDGGFPAWAECHTCHSQQKIDLEALAAKVGRDYSLWNRRCRCRWTPGCKGFTVFMCGGGWPHVMADEQREMWWVFNPIGGRP